MTEDQLEQFAMEHLGVVGSAYEHGQGVDA